MYSIPMKGITCCGDCAYYNTKKHKCNRCNSIETDARSHFYDDCPLPDVVKAQEPRVMTLEELKEGESYWFIAWGDFILRPVICVHREDDAQKPYIVFTWQYGTFSWESEDYGKRWRCWSSRPSAAEMEAVPWESVK